MSKQLQEFFQVDVENFFYHDLFCQIYSTNLQMGDWNYYVKDIGFNGCRYHFYNLTLSEYMITVSLYFM